MSAPTAEYNALAYRKAIVDHLVAYLQQQCLSLVADTPGIQIVADALPQAISVVPEPDIHDVVMGLSGESQRLETELQQYQYVRKEQHAILTSPKAKKPAKAPAAKKATRKKAATRRSKSAK